MSETSRILIEYGTSLRAVSAHSLFAMSSTHWFNRGSVTTTVVSVICLSYSLPIAISWAVEIADAGAGMVAHSIARLRTMTKDRRNGMAASSMRTPGERGSSFDARPALSTVARRRLRIACGQRKLLVHAVWNAQGRAPSARNGRRIMVQEGFR